MKDQKTKEKFVELRAEGLSFDKISKKIKVSKPTLIEWNKEMISEINEQKYIRYDEILERYKLTKERRMARLSKALDQAWEEYEKKDYKDLSKRELLMIINQLDKRLMEEIRDKEDIKNESKKLEINLVRTLLGNDGKTYLVSDDGKHRKLLKDKQN